MKKVYKLQGLDCANCAQKMENGIKKINGVQNASVSFLTQKLMLEAEDAVFDTLLRQVVKTCKKIEPDCEIML